MSASPFRVLLLLLYVATMAGLIVVMSPTDGQINLAKDWGIKIPQADHLLEDKKEAEALNQRIRGIIAKIEARGDQPLQIPDSEPTNERVSIKPEAERAPEELADHIQFGPHDLGILANFFESLQRLEADSADLVRILHYGDSQLEGDRISSYLRAMMQERFGGCGVGTVPITEVGLRGTIKQEAGDTWKKFTVFGGQPSPHKKYGHLGNYHHANGTIPEPGDSLSIFDNPNWVRFFRSPYGSNAKANTFEQIKIFYRSAANPLMVQASVNGQSPQVYKMPGQDEYSHFTLPLSTEPDKFRELKLHFGALSPFDVYGISLDCQRGIALDNIALRGSSGTDFTKISRSFLRGQLEMLNTKLIIFQFGVNVVPYMMGDFENYERMIYQQLKYLQSLKPDDVDIIVIGVSDMSQKQGVEMASYPNVKYIRDAQRRAAFRADCAFWDLYEVMGGENSMITWVEDKLAAKDHTHFSAKGARIVGQLFFEALMDEYERYLSALENVE